MFTLASRPGAAQDVIISEFLASNASTLIDEDGDSSDWIELQNISAAPILLEGYYLTDDYRNPGKWRFPAVQLEAGGFLVVFASGKDRADPAGELHTSFSLEGEGEYLALVAPGPGAVVHAYDPAFPPQRTDISYGLLAAVADILPGGHPVDVKVPLDAGLGSAWTAADFAPDASWLAGTSGAGFNAGGGDASHP
ncbi:MAG: lamin tail domain-containing protein, partial [Planctomycetes bacterium]|nr:lamin tail domain-containing protein [Planctomycetota bacterium]